MNIKLLRSLSLAYLLLPNILFFSFWTNLPIAIAGAAILIYLFLNVINDKTFFSDDTLRPGDLIKLAVTALIITFMSGICGLSYQTFDYWCHNVKFFELFSYDWPIRIPRDGAVISYYYGYYVVPALFSKAVGGISEWFIFIWSYAGFFLGLAWVYAVLNKKMVFVLLALAVGDMPHVFKTVFYKITGALYEFGDFGIESWSNFENLLWVPNQVIPTLIIGGMLVYLLKNKLPLEHIVFPVALTFWWAVFPAFTTGLLAAVLIIRNWLGAGLRLDWNFVIKTVVLPALVCLPVLLFFMSHEQAPVSGFIWQFRDSMSSRVVEYLINIAFNVIVFFLVYRFFNSATNSALPDFPFYLILFCILVFPIYRIGKVNDFLFRGLMPYLLIVGLYLFQPFSKMDWGITWKRLKVSPLHMAVLLLLVSSCLIGAGRLVRSLRINLLTQRLMPEKVAFAPIPYDAYPNIYEVLKDKWTQQEADQYLGKKDSLYELKMAPSKPEDNSK